jgi:hypothetical protein
MMSISASEFDALCRRVKSIRDEGGRFMNRHDLGCLAVAITSYLTSEYFTELAPGTQRMRRNLLKNIFAEVERLSAAEISEARNEIPSETPARSAPWRPVHQRRNWTTA